MKKIGLLLIFALGFSSCDKFEMRGFVVAYEQVNERFDQSIGWNNDHPFKQLVVPNDDYSIFSMGDSHVGGTMNLDIFFNEGINSGATAAVFVGDMTTGHTEDYDTFHSHLPEAGILPYFPIVGNHDLYFDGWKKYQQLFGTSSYLFTVETPVATDLFICLDSGSGTLGSAQLQWLKNLLKVERSNYRHCILFTHNNLFRIKHTFSTNPFVEEIRELADLSVRYEIDMIVTGHDHQRNVATLGNTVHITMDALEDIKEDATYLKLRINQSDLTYQFIPVK